MSDNAPEPRFRYPFHAVLLAGLCWLFYVIVLLPLALFMLPIVPLAPLFIVIMIGLGGLLGSVHEYARSVATAARASTLGPRVDAKAAQVPHVAS